MIEKDHLATVPLLEDEKPVIASEHSERGNLALKSESVDHFANARDDDLRVGN